MTAAVATVVATAKLRRTAIEYCSEVESQWHPGIQLILIHFGSVCVCEPSTRVGPYCAVDSSCLWSFSRAEYSWLSSLLHMLCVLSLCINAIIMIESFNVNWIKRLECWRSVSSFRSNRCMQDYHTAPALLIHDWVKCGVCAAATEWPSSAQLDSTQLLLSATRHYCHCRSFVI